MSYVPGQYNLGPDHSVSIVRTDTGDTITLDGPQTKFESQYADEVTKFDTIDLGGMVFGIRQPGGLTGTIDTDRADEDFAILFAYLDANYYAQGPHVFFSMTETILSADRTTSRSYQFMNVVFHSNHRGTWQNKGRVSTAVQFFSSQVVPV